MKSKNNKLKSIFLVFANDYYFCNSTLKVEKMNIEKYMIPCMSKKLLGIDCPGCGGQRAFVMLLKGEFSNAFHMFPAIFTTVILFGLIGLQLINKNRNYQKIIIPLAIINAVIMLVAYFYKMTNF